MAKQTIPQICSQKPAPATVNGKAQQVKLAQVVEVKRGEVVKARVTAVEGGQDAGGVVEGEEEIGVEGGGQPGYLEVEGLTDSDLSTRPSIARLSSVSAGRCPE